MTPEDKQLIAEYMGWEIEFDYYVDHRIKKAINFDLNDAGLCVEKMVEKGEWWGFYDFFSSNPPEGFIYPHEFTKWLFNPDNFFTAMASWLKTK